MKTKRLFDENAYETTFLASVLECKKEEKGYAVVLDQTLFFPEEGGQSPDKGEINGLEVLDVQVENQVITHWVKEELTPGTNVTAHIDWEHRFSNMQQHSGEHIFSGTVSRWFGLDNVGFHLSDQIVTMDFNGVLTLKQIEQVEEEVNRIISSNIEITVTYPTKETLENLEYRSKKEIDGQIRIVTIGEYDVCACCAPHVRRTGEIGLLKVMNVSNYKGGVRVSILCGKRALLEYREKAKILGELTNLLTTGEDRLVDTISKQKSLLQTQKQELSQIKTQLLQEKVKEIPTEQKDVLLFEKNIEVGVLRNVINGLVEIHEGYCGIFIEQENGYQFIIGSKNLDCKEIAKKIKETLNGKGGGSPQMIQGSVLASQEQILAIFKV